LENTKNYKGVIEVPNRAVFV